MKNFFKFLCGLASIAALGFGAYCIYKKVSELNEDNDKEEDLFEDEASEDATPDREYVSLHISEENKEASEETEALDPEEI